MSNLVREEELRAHSELELCYVEKLFEKKMRATLLHSLFV